MSILDYKDKNECTAIQRKLLKVPLLDRQRRGKQAAEAGGGATGVGANMLGARPCATEGDDRLRGSVWEGCR